MRFTPESCTVRYAQEYGKAIETLKGRWPLENKALKLDFREERIGDKPAYSFRLEAKRPLHIEEISLHGRIEGTLRPISVRKEGFQSWSYCDVVDHDNLQQRPRADFVVANQEAVWNPPTGKAGVHTSETFLILDDGLGESLMLAQQAPFDENLSFRLETMTQPAKLDLSWILMRRFDKDETLETGSCGVSSGCAELLLEEWSKAAAASNAFDPAPGAPVGWCSWYYYFNKITPEALRKNLAVAKERKLGFDIFQIDDGWQRSIGNWTETAPHFEEQMQSLAAEIREAGFTPGLWLAPFLVAKNSTAFQKPGWVLRNAKGKPVVAGYNPAWKGRFFALDLTHPEVQAYLDQVFRTVSREWGYEYLKLDFLYAASLPGKRYDPRKNPLEVLREGLLRIREAAAPGTRLMGCGMPITAALGAVDAARISCDVAPRWGQSRRDRLLRSDSNLETRGTIRNTVLRSHMNRRFWHNDPDCLMLRKENTELSQTERETHRAAVLYAGGSLFVSDDLSAYGEEEFELLERSLEEAAELRGEDTVSLRMFDDRGVYALFNRRGYLAIFNLNDQEVTVEFRLARFREILEPFTSYRPFEGAEDHPLEAPRNLELPARGFKIIRLSR